MYLYVIYSENRYEDLLSFKQKNNISDFYPVVAIEQSALSHLTPDMLFNTKKLQNKIKKEITLQDISKTLSHIKCWEKILANQNIPDNEFVIVAETDITLSENGLAALEEHINSFLYNSIYQIILLQRSDNEVYWNDRVYSGQGKIASVIFNQPYSYNNVGSSFYAIRKIKIKQIIELLDSNKPYWLADYFSDFCDFNLIAQTDPLIAVTNKKALFAQYKSSDNPLFTIIIPVYNVEKYLAYAIDSVLTQNYYDYEIILINDGSTDRSAEICFNYAQSYPHITLIQQANSGVSVSRNNAIKIARGKYLMFLDSDDYWQGTSILAELAEIIVSKQPDLIINHLTSLYADHTESHLLSIEGLTNNYYDDFIELVKRKIYQGFSFIKVVKTEIIHRHNIYFPEGKHYEDVLWSIKLAKAVQTYENYHSAFYIYRREREGSITQYVTIRNLIDLFDIYSKSYNEITQLDKNSHIYQGIRLFLIDFIQYIHQCYNLLNEESRHEIQQEYIEFSHSASKLTQ